MQTNKQRNIKDTAIRIRIKSDVKNRANDVFHSMGLTMSQAINMYLMQVAAKQASLLNFDVPNKETAKALREAKAGKGLIESKSIEDLFTETGIE